MNYMILKSEDVDDLVKRVNNYMEHNWKPQGGVFKFVTFAPDAKPNVTGGYADAERCCWLAQPMV